MQPGTGYRALSAETAGRIYGLTPHRFSEVATLMWNLSHPEKQVDGLLDGQGIQKIQLNDPEATTAINYSSFLMLCQIFTVFPVHFGRGDAFGLS